MQRNQPPSPIKIGSAVFDFTRTYVIGILNVTPDSFSDGGRFLDLDQAVQHALKMASEGADIIDIGGESTRPGAEPLSLDAELARVLPVIKEIRRQSDIPISIDTYKSAVAGASIEAGANLINDISGLRFDSAMASTAAHLCVPVIAMHIKGEPRSMQSNPTYDDLIAEIKTYLSESISIAENAGIKRENVIIDPGIGFGKTLAHNFSILRHLGEFAELGQPMMVGASRKRFLGSLSGTDPYDRLEESLAAAIIAAANGAHFIRVHDVPQTVRALKVWDAVKGSE
ncbi:MAG: dihydropteroate synthase [Candidatus Zixiibacteriota bacterium]